MTDTPLVLPYDVEGGLIEVLDRRHKDHLAKVERLRGLAPRTFETFDSGTMARMSDAGALKLSGDTTPALLVGVIGAPTFERTEEETVNAVYQIGMQITVMGQRRRDTLMKRDVMAWTVVECLYQRLPRGRGSIYNSIRLVDYEPLAEVETQRTVGDARLVWEVGVKDVLSITGGLPPDDSDWPVEAGGAPSDPYDPPGDRPAPSELTFTLDRDPIVE